MTRRKTVDLEMMNPFSMSAYKILDLYYRMQYNGAHKRMIVSAATKKGCGTPEYCGRVIHALRDRGFLTIGDVKGRVKYVRVTKLGERVVMKAHELQKILPKPKEQPEKK